MVEDAGAVRDADLLGMARESLVLALTRVRDRPGQTTASPATDSLALGRDAAARMRTRLTCLLAARVSRSAHKRLPGLVDVWLLVSTQEAEG